MTFRTNNFFYRFSDLLFQLIRSQTRQTSTWKTHKKIRKRETQGKRSEKRKGINQDVGRNQAPKSKANKASEGADILTRELNVRAHYHASFIVIQSISLLCTDKKFSILRSYNTNPENPGHNPDTNHFTHNTLKTPTTLDLLTERGPTKKNINRSNDPRNGYDMWNPKTNKTSLHYHVKASYSIEFS